MKRIVLGAIVPAFIVAALQWVMQLVFALVFATALVLGQPFKHQPLMFVNMALSQTILLIGAALYAGLLRRRSKASLSGCTVGGATVGLLANLASQLANSVLIFLAVAFMVDEPVWTAVLVLLLFPCLCFGIVGLIIGEVGGGAVGLFVPMPSDKRVTGAVSLVKPLSPEELPPGRQRDESFI